MRNGGKWEEKESRGKGRVDVHTEEQAIRLEFFLKREEKSQMKETETPRK